MIRPRLALWILSRADTSGVREALVGDLLEEITHGRSRAWVWQQVIGLYGYTLLAVAQRQARMSPFLVALVLGTPLLVGMTVAPPGRVVETWAGVYLCAGLLSLFAEVTWRTSHSRMLMIPMDSDEAGYRSLV